MFANERRKKGEKVFYLFFSLKTSQKNKQNSIQVLCNKTEQTKKQFCPFSFPRKLIHPSFFCVFSIYRKLLNQSNNSTEAPLSCRYSSGVFPFLSLISYCNFNCCFGMTSSQNALSVSKLE